MDLRRDARNVNLRCGWPHFPLELVFLRLIVWLIGQFVQGHIFLTFLRLLVLTVQKIIGQGFIRHTKQIVALDARNEALIPSHWALLVKGQAWMCGHFLPRLVSGEARARVLRPLHVVRDLIKLVVGLFYVSGDETGVSWHFLGWSLHLHFRLFWFPEILCDALSGPVSLPNVLHIQIEI